MKKALITAVALVAGVAAAILPGAPAQAFGGESLSCSVDGVAWGSTCYPSYPQGNYHLSFQVQGGSGTYSYAWTINLGGLHASQQSGCGPTSSSCSLLVLSRNIDTEVDVYVTITQGGQSEPLSASFEQYCVVAGSRWC